MSLKAKAVESSYRMVAGISFETILSKMVGWSEAGGLDHRPVSMCRQMTNQGAVGPVRNPADPCQQHMGFPSRPKHHCLLA